MLVKLLSVIHSLCFFSLYHWPGAVSHCLTWAHFLLHINSISELCAFVWFVITKAALASLSISQSKRCTIAPFSVKAFSAYWLSRIWNYNLTNPDFASMQIYPKWRKWRKKLSFCIFKKRYNKNQFYFAEITDKCFWYSLLFISTQQAGLFSPFPYCS